MDLFNVIPEDFFSILASKNKRLYLACAIQAFNVYESGSILGIDKKTIVDDLEYFLEKHQNLLFNKDDIDDFEDTISSNREKVNYVLRRLEQTGWIQLDLTNDYVEILNFTDNAITIIEALISLYPSSMYVFSDDYDEDTIQFESNFNQDEYHGYIYTIYSLLNNISTDDMSNNNVDYDLIVKEVYKNTKKLIRSLRKLDSRMKEYIYSVVENAEIKDLIEKLVIYKTELFDQSYLRLKTSDNINKYKLNIVDKLEKMEKDTEIINNLKDSYKFRFRTPELALSRVYRDLDEMIDVFNGLDEMINEIDSKNKVYVNSTIGKIKFLLSEEDNIAGKLNTILKYLRQSNKEDNLDKAINKVSSVLKLSQSKSFKPNSSLYTPRGRYEHNKNQTIDMSRFEFDVEGSMLDDFKNNYDETEILKYMEETVEKFGRIKASEQLSNESEFEDCLILIYALLVSDGYIYKVNRIDEYVETKNFIIKDFEIVKVGT
ncbi:MAG: Wadjet anti-phage system protein JetA family protein [Anaeroplasmataceae bacterium]